MNTFGRILKMEVRTYKDVDKSEEKGSSSFTTAEADAIITDEILEYAIPGHRQRYWNKARFAPDLPLPDAVSGQVTYHDSCKGLRGLGIKQQPRALLARVKGLTLSEMADCEECCGFGGAFSVNFGDVSTRIVDRKCESIAAVGADAVEGGDLGCLLNIEGRLRRRGDERTHVLHIAEVLAGGGES